MKSKSFDELNPQPTVPKQVNQTNLNAGHQHMLSDTLLKSSGQG
jgi:hypothetical protein